MEEILHQLRYIEPSNLWDSWHINWVQDFFISSINSIMEYKMYIYNNTNNNKNYKNNNNNTPTFCHFQTWSNSTKSLRPLPMAVPGDRCPLLSPKKWQAQWLMKNEKKHGNMTCKLYQVSHAHTHTHWYTYTCVHPLWLFECKYLDIYTCIMYINNYVHAI